MRTKSSRGGGGQRECLCVLLRGAGGRVTLFEVLRDADVQFCIMIPVFHNLISKKKHRDLKVTSIGAAMIQILDLRAMIQSRRPLLLGWRPGLFFSRESAVLSLCRPGTCFFFAAHWVRRCWAHRDGGNRSSARAPRLGLRDFRHLQAEGDGPILRIRWTSTHSDTEVVVVWPTPPPHPPDPR